MRLEAEWLRRPGLAAVMQALEGRAWVVGGAVRDGILHRPVLDIDLATPLQPAEVMRRLRKSRIRAVPTGIEHGTVTAVADGRPYEVTTFRTDVETDGRHATVRFGTTLEEDAGRRDFTLNALYCDAAGAVADPLGAGLEDLHARRVRFIGDPHRRIREDFLRILRFFRFSAHYADGMDPEGLAACAAEAEGLDRLARERVGAEMRKLLAAPDPAPAVAAMAASGVLARALPGAQPTLLAPLVHAEQEAGIAPDWRVRLAALGSTAPAEALRLSRAEQRFLADLAALLQTPRPPAVEAWDAGPELARAAGLLRAAAGTPLPRDFEADLARGAAARMPLQAGDLIEAGMKEGPALGAALSRARAAWAASEFSLDRAALLREALCKGQQR